MSTKNRLAERTVRSELRWNVLLLVVLTYLQIFGYEQLAKPFCAGGPHTLPASRLSADYPCTGSLLDKVSYLAIRPWRVYVDYMRLQHPDCWVTASAVCLLLRLLLAIVCPACTSVRWVAAGHRLVAPATLLAWALTFGQEPSALALWFIRSWPLLDCAYVLAFPTSVAAEIVYGICSFVISALLGLAIQSSRPNLVATLTTCAVSTAWSLYVHVCWQKQPLAASAAVSPRRLGGPSGNNRSSGSSGGAVDVSDAGAGGGGGGGRGRGCLESRGGIGAGGLGALWAVVRSAAAACLRAMSMDDPWVGGVVRRDQDAAVVPTASGACNGGGCGGGGGGAHQAREGLTARRWRQGSSNGGGDGEGFAGDGLATSVKGTPAGYVSREVPQPLPCGGAYGPYRGLSSPHDDEVLADGAGSFPATAAAVAAAAEHAVVATFPDDDDGDALPNSSWAQDWGSGSGGGGSESRSGGGTAESLTQAAAAAAAAPPLATTTASPAEPAQPHVSYIPVLRLVRLQVKIRGADPEQVPPGYRDRIARVVRTAGYELDSVYMRRGCIELVVNARDWRNNKNLSYSTTTDAESLTASEAPMDVGGVSAAGGDGDGDGDVGGICGVEASGAEARLFGLGLNRRSSNGDSGRGGGGVFGGGGDGSIGPLIMGAKVVDVRVAPPLQGDADGGGESMSPVFGLLAAPPGASSGPGAAEPAEAAASGRSVVSSGGVDIDIGAIIRALKIDFESDASECDSESGGGAGDGGGATVEMDAGVWTAAVAYGGGGGGGSGSGGDARGAEMSTTTTTTMTTTMTEGPRQGQVGWDHPALLLQQPLRPAGVVPPPGSSPSYYRRPTAPYSSAGAAVADEATTYAERFPRMAAGAAASASHVAAAAAAAGPASAEAPAGSAAAAAAAVRTWSVSVVPRVLCPLVRSSGGERREGRGGSHTRLGAGGGGDGGGGGAGAAPAVGATAAAALPTGTIYGPFRLDVEVIWPPLRDEDDSFAAAAPASPAVLPAAAAFSSPSSSAAADRQVNQLHLLLRSRDRHLPARVVEITASTPPPWERLQPPTGIDGDQLRSAEPLPPPPGIGLRYTLEVPYLPVRSGLLLVDVIGVAAVPVVLLHDEAAASELQDAVEMWAGSPGELDDLLFDLATYLAELADAESLLTAATPASRGRAVGGGLSVGLGGGGLPGSGDCTERVLPLAPRFVGLGFHLLDYAVQNGWDKLSAVLQNQLWRAASTGCLGLSAPPRLVESPLGGPPQRAPRQGGSESGGGGGAAAAATLAAAPLVTENAVRAAVQPHTDFGGVAGDPHVDGSAGGSAGGTAVAAAAAPSPLAAVLNSLHVQYRIQLPAGWRILTSTTSLFSLRSGRLPGQRRRRRGGGGGGSISDGDGSGDVGGVALDSGTRGTSSNGSSSSGSSSRGGGVGGARLAPYEPSGLHLADMLMRTPAGCDPADFGRYKGSWRAAQAYFMQWVDTGLSAAVLLRLADQGLLCSAPLERTTVAITVMAAVLSTAPGVACAMAWLALPRAQWLVVVEHCVWLRLLSTYLTKLLFIMTGWRLMPSLSRYDQGLPVWMLEGVAMPAASLLSPLSALLVAAARVPLVARSWLLLACDMQPPCIAARQTEALVRSCKIGALSLATSLACHWYLCRCYRRRQARGRGAKLVANH